MVEKPHLFHVGAEPLPTPAVDPPAVPRRHGRPILGRGAPRRWPLGGQALRSGRARGSGGLCGLVELLDAGGELEVALGQPTLGVAGEDEGDPVPADVDVGVVAGRLGRAGDLVHERHRAGEVLAHERLDDLVAAPLPAGQALQALLDGVVVQQWHGTLLPDGMIVRHHGHRWMTTGAASPPTTSPPVAPAPPGIRPSTSLPSLTCSPGWAACSSPPGICWLIRPSPPQQKTSLCSMPAPSEHEPRTSSSARPLNDGSHLLSVERFHGLCPDVAKRAKLKQCGGGGLVVREVDDSHGVVLAEYPKNLTNLAAVLLDEAPEVLGPTDGVAEILGALVGPIDQGDVGGHGPAPFPPIGRTDRSR